SGPRISRTREDHEPGGQRDDVRYTRPVSKTALDTALAVLVAPIVAIAQPDRIILFGSAARGDMGPDSDIDSSSSRRTSSIAATSLRKSTPTFRASTSRSTSLS